MRRVLVVNDHDGARQSLQLGLRRAGYDTLGVASIADAGRALEADPYLGVVVSWAMLNGAPLRLPPTAGLAPTLIAIVPSEATATAGLAAMGQGAHDFIVDTGDLAPAAVLALEKAEARAGRSRDQSQSVTAAAGTPRAAGNGAAVSPMVGNSAPMAALAAAVRKVAPYKATVFVQGESGTGKELIARALHQQSSRADGPFVAVNCGAIPAGLMESELFGHSKGAFTDALRDRAGLLEQASVGTLFLDEIAELPLALQVKLLRVLQEDSVRRLGDAEERPIDVRLVAATARDLEAEVAAGRFREDLFHRINVVGLRVPPLRERADDIPLLVDHFLARVNQRLGLSLRRVSDPAMRVLVGYAWPGNVRELENTVERAAVMSEGDEIDLASLPERILRGKSAGGTPVGRAVGGASPSSSSSSGAGAGPGSPAPGADGSEDLSIKRASRRAEEDLIRRALVRTGGNRTRAAELLEISHRALLYKIKEYGVVLPMPFSGTARDGKL